LRQAVSRWAALSDLITLEQWQRRALSLRPKEVLSGVWEYWL